MVTVGSAAEATVFLRPCDAERVAHRLALALAAREGRVQVLVRNHAGLTIGSTVFGPERPRRLGLVHPEG
jgi:hypothetical protein